MGVGGTEEVMDLGGQRGFLEVSLRMKSVVKRRGRKRGGMVREGSIPLEEAACRISQRLRGSMAGWRTV